MKKTTYILMLAIGLVSLNACNESEYDLENIVPEEYYKILYINDDGIQDMLLYETGEDFEYTFSVFKAGSDPMLPAHAQVGVMTQEEVDTEYGITGIDYKIIPENTYVLEDNELDFSSTDTYKLVNVQLKPELIKDMIYEGQDVSWLLPIKVTSEKDSVNGNKDHIAFHFTDVLVPVVLFETDFESKSVDFDRVSDFELNVPVTLSVVNQWDIDSEFELDEEYIIEYNAANGTNYQPFPNDIINFDSQVALASTEEKADLNIKVNASSLPVGNFMLPIRMKDVSQFTVSEDGGLYVMTLEIMAPQLDRTGWTAEANTEETVREGENGFVHTVLDGDYNSFWHSQYDGSFAPLPHDIIIDMKAEYEVRQIGLAPRLNNRYVKGGEILISRDKISWEKVGKFRMPDDTNDSQYFQVTPVKGRYVQIHITESHHQDDCSALSEVTVYGF